MKKVVMYTSDTCGYCHMAKDFLKANNIEFQEKNISESVEYRNELMAQGFMGVPVIKVDEEVIEGFDKKRLQELLLDK